jgi:hypothetical protein
VKREQIFRIADASSSLLLAFDTYTDAVKHLSRALENLDQTGAENVYDRELAIATVEVSCETTRAAAEGLRKLFELHKMGQPQ